VAANKRWRLVCYDIRDPRRLREVHKIVTGHGHRVQYSIYRARLDDLQVEQLRWELSRVMAPEDSLLILDLCPTCAANVISRNHVEGWQDSVPSFRVIGGDAGSTERASVDDNSEQLRECLDPEDEEGDPPV
jgi:CRISPR-associated protein Cas2